jgi:hypothetical protein
MKRRKLLAVMLPVATDDNTPYLHHKDVVVAWLDCGSEIPTQEVADPLEITTYSSNRTSILASKCD